MHQDQLSLREKVKSMSQLLDSTIKQTRRIVTELRPGVLDDLGLAAALEWQAGELQNHTGIACRVSISPRNITINSAIATALFRIAQEALTNVVRHAQASRVEITLRKRDNRLLLRVKDNGRGITTEKLSDSNSLGLMGMRERLLHWNGEVKIRGVKGKGTTVTAIVPLS
ncbi:MAG: sensor histidine kinase [Dehalococcoidia bacterium]|nr:sensor histidine kinase [Dehalococcoidia bacterium]